MSQGLQSQSQMVNELGSQLFDPSKFDYDDLSDNNTQIIFNYWLYLERIIKSLEDKYIPLKRYNESQHNKNISSTHDLLDELIKQYKEERNTVLDLSFERLLRIQKEGRPIIFKTVKKPEKKFFSFISNTNSDKGISSLRGGTRVSKKNNKLTKKLTKKYSK
jgi:hypothetical protein